MSFITFDYPREVLIIGDKTTRGYRRIVHDKSELHKYWEGRNGISNAYFTAYGYRGTTPPKHHRVDYNTPVIRHFVLDFDCKDFKQRGVEVEFSFMHEQVKRLHKHLIDNDYLHYVWFSGGGFHFWIPIDETLMPTNGFEVTRIKNGGKNLLRKWHDALNISCCDPTVAFDMSGMIRIPNSFNMRRSCWSIPLQSDEIMNLDYYELLDVAQDAREGYISLGTTPLHLELPVRRAMQFTKRKRQVDLPDISHDKMLILPCLAQSALGEGNPIHKARFHLASYLAARLRWFFPPDTVKESERVEHIEKIVDFCGAQGWVDYDEDITRTQVTSIVETGYSLSTCKTLITEGLCSGICRYYDGTAEGMV
jgi:hypothetical protein